MYNTEFGQKLNMALTNIEVVMNDVMNDVMILD